MAANQDIQDGYVTVPILYYHHVGFIKDAKDEFRKLSTVNPSNFKDQMRMLKEGDFAVISLHDLVSALMGESNIPERSIILTFDDGYRDYYDYVFPILKEFGFTSINFVILNSLDLDDNLTIPQVREMLESGIFEVGAHTVSHAKLTALSEREVITEVMDSKNALERKLKTKIFFFAYPGGFHNQQVEEIVQQVGYLGAVSTIGGINHGLSEKYRLKRVKVGNWDGDRLRNTLRSLGAAF